MRTVVFRIKNYKEFLKSWGEGDHELLKYGLSNCMEELLEEYNIGEFFFNSNDEIIILFMSEDTQNEKFSRLLVRIVEVFTKIFSFVVSGGIYDSEEEIALKKQYQCAVNAMDYSFLFGSNKIISYNAVKNFTQELEVDNIYSCIDRAMKTMDFNALLDEIEEIEHSTPSHKCLLELVEMNEEIVKGLRKIARSLDIDSDLFDDKVPVENILALKQEVLRLNDRISSETTNEDSSIKKIKNYIKDNYFKDISLREIAKMFNYDYTNLSKKFYKIYGVSYSKFLTDVRLAEAMELIKTTDYKMIEISRMVGYNNYATFSRAFKDRYGKWPKEIIRGIEN